MNNINSVTRFSNTVENYVKFRPGYPAALVRDIESLCQLNDNSIIAEIGSGTGIFTKLITPYWQTFAVEPGEEMRRVADETLANDPNYNSVMGSADRTLLPTDSVDCIICAQAFHWFNNDETKEEFKRILKPSGHVALIWNLRKNDTPFMQSYEAILHKYGTDYKSVKAENISDEDIQSFFIPNHVEKTTIDHTQFFDLHGVTGRLLSTSYTPKKGTPDCQQMLHELETSFKQNQVNESIEFKYTAVCYVGKLDK